MLDILFISDYVCPYCLVAKEALKQALEEMKIEVKITWQPLELTVEPAPRVDTYSDERRRANYQVLVEPCKQLGLDMKLPPKVIPRPYSRLAFEGWYFAQEKGLGEVYNDLIYRAYFIDEKDIGDMEVLTELAEKIGLNRAEYKEVLVKGTFSRMEKEAVDYARNVLKPEGVPTVYINGNKITLETYTKEEMLQILRRECYG
jgi:predicted DsbA family dithiol-disulfide isomerase